MNAVGGQDELVFDGGSVVVGPDGEACRAAQFEEDLLVVDIDDEQARADHDAVWPEPPASIYRALVLGLRLRRQERVRRCGARALGGIDSALVAVLAADALGAESVRALAMPSPYSSPESLEDATEVASGGIALDVASIGDVFDAYRSSLRLSFEGARGRHGGEPPGADPRQPPDGRLNKPGWLVLATGNKSEYAVGYATLYGDMAGGFAPIKDVPKTLVFELCRWRNDEGPGVPIPERVMTKPPSAELRPDQKDTDSLPPTTSSTRSSRPTSRTTSASTRSSSEDTIA